MVKEETYKEQFYELNKALRKHYFEMAGWQWLNFTPRRVIDFGRAEALPEHRCRVSNIKLRTAFTKSDLCRLTN